MLIHNQGDPCAPLCSSPPWPWSPPPFPPRRPPLCHLEDHGFEFGNRIANWKMITRGGRCTMSVVVGKASFLFQHRAGDPPERLQWAVGLGKERLDLRPPAAGCSGEEARKALVEAAGAFGKLMDDLQPGASSSRAAGAT